MNINVIDAPLIVGIGGGANSNSSTEKLLSLALEEARTHGVRSELFGGQHLALLPHYATPGATVSPEGKALVAAIRRADGLIIASPGYHGSLSGVVKNAIDYVEETARDSRPYFTDLPVGLIAVAGGAQAAMSTLCALRTIVHALRGWPTPFGASLNSSTMQFRDGVCIDTTAIDHIKLVSAQVATFALRAKRIRPTGNQEREDKAWL